MDHLSRRGFLNASSIFAAATTSGLPKSVRNLQVSEHESAAREAEQLDLCSTWQFRTDPEAAGEKSGWPSGDTSAAAWRSVIVPHTWQVEAPLVDYRGSAWYTKSVFAPEVWAHGVVRIEFEAVFHSASVWINGQLAGEHLRKGYTAFTFDISRFLKLGGENLISVRVDNAFNEHMLPRGRSSDWAFDGGIYRPVRLLISNRVYTQRVAVDTAPNFLTGAADLNVTAYLYSAVPGPVSGSLRLRIVDEETGDIVLADKQPTSFQAGQAGPISMPIRRSLAHAKLWHFDAPHLYRLELVTEWNGRQELFTTRFGFRKLEVRDRAFYFNNEKVVLTGVERMAGSNPEFGMAEPSDWIERDHADLKHLNCIFTRVHWPQDRRVLDYCDRHGILMQEEVPSWGAATFSGMTSQPDTDLMENGLEQLREMVARDRNHACIISWGLCNEINGQNPPAYNFAKNMLAEAKKIDPGRLCSYASNSLFHDQVKDVSGLMDFVECNQYLGSWEAGGPPELDRLMDEIHTGFPDKPIVISEYGYCACTADRLEGDGHRIAVLTGQNAVLRTKPFIAGAIFFCYNDYRTHMGDRGEGVMKQRIHGVVDVFGAPKPSYSVLRNESSPLESLTFENFPAHVLLHIRARSILPGYTLRGYSVRALFYEADNIPLKRMEQALPELAPGAQATLQFDFGGSQPQRIAFDVLRPTAFSAASLDWLR
jgi:beta-galactosidase